MKFKTFLLETLSQNDILEGRTEIRNKFRSDFPIEQDIYHFRHTLEYMAQLAPAIIKALDLKLEKENIVNWNKSKTQKTTERYYKNDKYGIYLFSGTGMSWLKHSIGLLGARSQNDLDDCINTLKTLKEIIK